MDTIQEILLLTISFTVSALYMDVHGKGNLFQCITNHVIALLIALLISKAIYEWFHKN